MSLKLILHWEAWSPVETSAQLIQAWCVEQSRMRLKTVGKGWDQLQCPLCFLWTREGVLTFSYDMRSTQWLLCILSVWWGVEVKLERGIKSVSHSFVSNSLQPHGLWPSRLLCLWNSPGKSTGVGSHSLFQGIFPIKGLNPGLLHCRRILYCLSHQGSPFHFTDGEKWGSASRRARQG